MVVTGAVDLFSAALCVFLREVGITFVGRRQRSDERKIFTSHVAAGRVREQQRAKGVVRNLGWSGDTDEQRKPTNQPQRVNAAGH